MAFTGQNDTHSTNGEQQRVPFLRRVRIKGYKSIAFCDVSLEPLTVLVGRNASGKSNFLDALAFLRDAVEFSVSEAVNKRNGWRAVFCRSSSSPYIGIELEATFPSYQSIWDAEYSFALEAKHQIVQVRRERLTLRERAGNRRIGFVLDDGKLEWTGENVQFDDDSEWTTDEDIPRFLEASKLGNPRFLSRPQTDKLLLSVIATQPFCDLWIGLRASCIYNFSPSAIRAHQPITGTPFLVGDGKNVARAIAGLDEIEPETLVRVGNYLQAIVPEVEGFDRVPYGDFETIRFTMADPGSNSPREFDASSMSDGTLRILAALMAAFQVVLPNGYPGFIGIEEPETSLHPAAMRALVDALDEATRRTQILLSTHSAEMLDNPTIRPKNVRVVEMVDGRTVIGPVDEGSVEIVRRELDSLGGLERQNQLGLDADDLARQQHLAEQRPELVK